MSQKRECLLQRDAVHGGSQSQTRDRATQALWKSSHEITCPDSGMQLQALILTVTSVRLTLVQSVLNVQSVLLFEMLALCCSILGAGVEMEMCFGFTAKHSCPVPESPGSR